MNTRPAHVFVAVTAVVIGLVLVGCSSTPERTAADRTPSAAASTTATPQPPSTSVSARLLRDDVTGTTVQPLAIVTDLPIPAGATPGVKPVLVQVTVRAGDEYRNDVVPSAMSITPRDADLDLVTLGLGIPEDLAPVMSAAGYTPIPTVPSGSDATGWLGAWVKDDVDEFDLVYDRPAGTLLAVGSPENGREIPGSNAVTPLVVG